MDNITAFWLIIAVAALVIELSTVNLVSIWFVAGAVAAFIASILGVQIGTQVGIFVLVTAVLLIFTMPAARRIMKESRQATNSDRIIGQDAIVTEEINPIKASGQIMVLGSVWSAISEDGEVIANGSRVTVTGIRGVKAIVNKKAY